ncbi:MAG: hypothetical protein A2157_07625 [Deltaproteobacteria bacterium RBG_16_47_11]|nr:MAG: hypothetical protein A2157_07625 [Deltaproteobacteria bacterium RBG_16_47_11]
MNLKSMQSDLTTESFLILRNSFFGKGQKPRPYRLRDKRNTQDDPLDEYICRLLSDQFPADVDCLKAPGPLITPDLVVLRPEVCKKATRVNLTSSLTHIVAIEVKKLERTRSGTIARPSGMDYNTTPPCGTVRVYDSRGSALDIRGFYLFVCQETVPRQSGKYQLSSLVLCDGNLLNEDFNYYLSIVGERGKQIGLGTYGNGADRTRPMLIFSNPLSAPQLDQNVTLIHSRNDLDKEASQLRKVGAIKRTIQQGGTRAFYSYRLADDVPKDYEQFELLDPFRLPARTEKTQPRGRFRLNFQPAD